MADQTYTIEYEGLKLTVEATDIGGGQLSIKILCVDGYANINAFYWSDGIDDDTDFALTGKGAASLNMNGTDVDWDGGVKLSDTGLGKTPPPTYLQEGESYSFNITASLDDLATIGIRATSTSNPEGSIKGVAEPDEPEVPDDHFPDFKEETGSSISHVTFYFDTPDGFVGDVAGIDPENDGKGPQSPDGWFTVKFNDQAALSDDLDDWYDDALAYIIAQNPTLDPSTLVGVSIKGGTTEVWYDTDNDPDDVDTPPDVWKVENKEVDQAYDVTVSDPFTVA